MTKAWKQKQTELAQRWRSTAREHATHHRNAQLALPFIRLMPGPLSQSDVGQCSTFLPHPEDPQWCRRCGRNWKYHHQVPFA